MKKLMLTAGALAALLVALPSAGLAGPIIRTAAGANAAAIQATVDQFRADLGGVNNGVVKASFATGRREINWDGVPDSLSSPNNLPANFFNATSPRGAVFTTPCGNATFRVSADSSNPTSTPVRFGELDPSYATTFTTFSAERLFTVISGDAVPCNILTVNFFVPGTQIPATVSGFGVVFTDIDVTGNARILAYGADGSLLLPGLLAPVASDGGLSFIGVSYDAGERIAQVQIVSGPDRLAAGNVDGAGGIDVVAMDDFIYGEPRALDRLSSDFDGDGKADLVVGAGAGGGPHVRVLSGADGHELRSFFAYDPAFTGGVRITTCDLNLDGVPDIVTAAGPGGGPHVRAFDGQTGLQFSGPAGSFFAYTAAFTGGVFVGCTDVNGDGLPDIVTGAGAGGGPHVRAFDGRTGVEILGFFAFNPAFLGGVFVAP
jgi:FG-GAP-like repeat